MWTWRRVLVHNSPCERCMVCNWLIVFWMMGACSCWFLGGRAVVSSFCRSCITQPMLGTWVLTKRLKLCNRGSGDLKCSSISSCLFGVVRCVNRLKTCCRHLLVCFSRLQYPMVSLSIGPLTLLQVFLKLMVLMPCYCV